MVIGMGTDELILLPRKNEKASGIDNKIKKSLTSSAFYRIFQLEGLH